jgi:hypothetical protein
VTIALFAGPLFCQSTMANVSGNIECQLLIDDQDRTHLAPTSIQSTHVCTTTAIIASAASGPWKSEGPAGTRTQTVPTGFLLTAGVLILIIILL